MREAELRSLRIGMAERTRKDSLYTIDYDSEGWIQCDTGHQFELFNNLNDDWEVVDGNLEDNDDAVNPVLQVNPVNNV